MAEVASGLVTILFTDLVGSTELLSKAGDEKAQRIFQAHHDLLVEAAVTHRGEEVKWLGDGLMVAFASAADAIRCAVAMQQASHRPVHGERLVIRVGLNAGETMRSAADYFGMPVVIARRLCDRAAAGQILCSQLVTELLAGRAGFAFVDLGPVELKGVPQPVVAAEVSYEATPFAELLRRMPFVGREAELNRLEESVAEMVTGRGGLVTISGEPGIGKTRLAEEFAERLSENAAVLWGRCFETEGAPPYAPFLQVLEAAMLAEPEDLQADLGHGAGPLAELVPAVRKVLDDVPEPVTLQPDEKRFRVIDSTAQFLIARSRRAPLLVCLDDLHWADRGTIAMLSHLARFLPRHKILVLASYRDVEVDPDHPLSEALGTLARSTECRSLHLEGLGATAMTELLAVLGEQDMSDKVGAVWARETEGNPFFVKELLRHLIEEGKLYRGPDGRWTTPGPLRDLNLPKGVQDVIDRRLARLSGDANRLLFASCGFESDVHFDIAAAVADLKEREALDALDEVLHAQLMQPTAGTDRYDFSHALIRHALYSGLNPSRRARLHRQVAEALEARYGTNPSPAQAAEIATQYHHSGGLPGAERGVGPALEAAAHAESAGAHNEAANFLRMALNLLPVADTGRPGLLGRLGLALAWGREFDQAADVATQAAEAITMAEGSDPAAAYLSEAAHACGLAGSSSHAWLLAEQGLALGGSRRDLAWARLVSYDAERQAAEHPDFPGIPLESADRRESARVLRQAHLDPLGLAPMEVVLDTRDEALESTNLIVHVVWAGEYARPLPLLEAEAETAVTRGQIARATRAWMMAAHCHIALGQLERAGHALDRARTLADRLGQPVFALLEARAALAATAGEVDEEVVAAQRGVAEARPRGAAFALGWICGRCAAFAAWEGDEDGALRFFGGLVPWLERAPAWTVGFPLIAHLAAEVLWVLQRSDHVELVERAVRDKVLASDFRCHHSDGRLSLARVCALTGRHDEAASWFEDARRVLSQQHARPLLAIADYDEALMEIRSEGSLDKTQRGRRLLDSARRAFETLGMTGWIRRVEDLERRLP